MWEIAVHLAVAGGVLLCFSFSQEMPLMKFSTILSQFLRVFLPTFVAHETPRSVHLGVNKSYH